MSTVPLIIMLFALPVCYLLISYVYLMLWHRKIWLFNVVMHEDGRHTLWGALTYWGHFLACVPTALFVSWCIAGGTLIAAYTYHNPTTSGIWISGLMLAVLGLLFVLAAVWGSVQKIGTQQTLHYALQKFERDNVSSWGGCWNQFIPSNLVIGLGSVAAGLVLGSSLRGSESWMTAASSASWKRWSVMGLAILWLVLVSIIYRTGRRSFTDPRWLAHSIREIATYPLTAVPAGLGAILWANYLLNPNGVWNTTIPLWAVGLFVIACILLVWQLTSLRGKDVIGLSQKPPFAPGGLSVAYLLASHVFEHTADMIFIALTSSGFYLLGLWAMSP